MKHSSNISTSSKAGHALRLVRMMRLSNEIGLSADIKSQLKCRILDFLSPAENRGAVKVWKEAAENYKLQIRKLVSVDAEWDRIKPLAFKYFELKPSNEVAAHLVELSFLHGQIDDVVETIGRVSSVGSEFYSFINRAIRHQLLMRFWNNGLLPKLASIVFWHRSENWLLPIEKLSVWMTLSAQEGSQTSFSYYKRHKKDIELVVTELGDKLKFNMSSLCLMLSKQALSIGKKSESRYFAKKVHPKDKEYKQSLDLLMSWEVDLKSLEQSSLYKDLKAEKAWHKRVALFDNYLEVAKSLASTADQNRVFLNTLLQDPFSWLPEFAEAWSELSSVMVSYFDLEPILPSIKKFYEKNIIIFHKADIEMALWRPVSDCSIEKGDLYFIGCSYLHQYLAGGGKNEEFLWKGRSLILKWFNENKGSDRISWEEIHHAMFIWVRKTPRLSKSHSDRLRLMLAVSKDPSKVKLSDIDEYLGGDTHIPLGVLEALQKTAQKVQSTDLEIRLIKHKAQMTSLSNQDLNDLWRLYVKVKNYDLAWRVCSILNSRQSLVSSAAQAWKFSGENRQLYQLFSLSKTDVNRCLSGFDENEKKLCRAIVQIGSALPVLLETELKTHLKVRSNDSEFETILDKHLDQFELFRLLNKKSFFGLGKTVYHKSTDLPFASRVPVNEWSQTFMAISHRLGLMSWNWSLSKLIRKMESLSIFRQQKDGATVFNARVNNWLKSLTPNQRAGIGMLHNASKKLTDEKSLECLAQFIMRVSTIVFQNHTQALSSVHDMRLSAKIIGDFERWLLSVDYEKIRVDHNSTLKVPVPHSLTLLDSILIHDDKSGSL